MTVGNLRALGITSIDVTCECGREAIVDASGWPDAPALRWHLECTECGGRPLYVGHIVDKSCKAWNFFADDKEAIASITSRHWAQVNP